MDYLINDNGVSEPEIRDLVQKVLTEDVPSEKRVLIIIPDMTRKAPIPMIFKAVVDALKGRVKKIDVLSALGTHPPMNDDEMAKRVGAKNGLKTDYPEIDFYNHDARNPDVLKEVVSFTAEEIQSFTDGMLNDAVTVKLHEKIFEYDHIILVSPVVTHETVGFSGGNKYFFPGVAGEDFIALFHWLGALITNYDINGVKDNPVRRLINQAAKSIPVPRSIVALVVSDKGCRGVFAGNVEEAWSKAADLSAETHIKYVDKPYQSVLGISPEYYTDIWVAGKVMYKLEPIIADGGELIIYAPHIKDISFTYGEAIQKVGYHCRDYFVKQMDKFDGIAKNILAHSTNVRGNGTFEEGVEYPRVQVTLATGIPESVCKEINLGYRDPESINISDWENKEESGKLLVHNAGQNLYRLKK